MAKLLGKKNNSTPARSLAAGFPGGRNTEKWYELEKQLLHDVKRKLFEKEYSQKIWDKSAMEWRLKNMLRSQRTGERLLERAGMRF